MNVEENEEIKRFINYLYNKVEDCYKEETSDMIQRFFERLNIVKEKELLSENER